MIPEPLREVDKHRKQRLSILVPMGQERAFQCLVFFPA
jgi:hypothetical protein